MKKIPLSLISAATALSSILLLSACGGGGGDTNANTSQSGNITTASSVTVSNSQEVGAQGYTAASSLSSSVNSGAGLVTAVSTQTPNSSLLDIVLQQTYSAIANEPSAGLVTGVSSSRTANCSGGGSVTVSYSVASTSTISAGDTLTIATNNCVESGTTLNGSMTVTFNSFTGTFSATGAWSGSLTYNFANTTLTIGTNSNTLDGDMSMSYNQSSYQVASYSVSGNSLQTATVTSGTSTSRTISAYSYTGTRSGSLYTFTPNFTISGQLGKLGNTAFTATTLTAFKQNGSSYPYEGVMKITATDNTSVTLTAIDSTSVKLDIDSDGDGTTNKTNTITWATLAASLL